MSTVMGSKQRSGIAGKERGFTLFEVILVVGVTATFVLGVFSVFNVLTERAAYRQSAKYLVTVQDALRGYVEVEYANFIGSIPDTGGVEEVTFTDIKNAGFLPAGYPELTPMAQQAVFFVYRSADKPAQLQALTVTNGRLLNNDVLISVARTGGTRFGIITDFGSNAGVIGSYAGTWRVDLADVAAVYAPVVTDAQGYIAVYDSVGGVAGGNSPFLYRVDVIDDDGGAAPFTIPNELNTMRTNIIMNGHNLVGANTISVDRLQAEGNTELLNVNNRPNVITVERYANITSSSNTIDIAQDLTVKGDGQDLPAGVDLIVNSLTQDTTSTSTAAINIERNLVLNGAISVTMTPLGAGGASFRTLDMQAANLNVLGGDLIVSPAATITGTDDIEAREKITVNSAEAASVDAARAAMSGASINVTGSLSNSGNYNVVNIIEVQGDAIIGAPGETNQFRVGTMEIDTLGNCNFEGGAPCEP